MQTRRRHKKKQPKKSNRSGIVPSLMMRSEPVLPDGQRINCDLTTRTYRADIKTLDEAGRSIESVIATEARVMVVDWARYEVIEEILLMSGFRAPDSGQVPLLDTHDRSTVQSQHGSTRNIRVERDTLVGRDYFSSSKETEHAWTMTKEAHLTDRSAGYRVLESVRIEAGQSATVAGKKYTASATLPLRIAQQWELRENSLCPIGADMDAKIRHEASPVGGQFLTRKESTMDKFKEWLQARGLSYDALTDAQRTALENDWKADCQRQEAPAASQTPPPQPQRSEPAAASQVPQQRSNDGMISAEEAQRRADAAVQAEFARRSAIRAEASGFGMDEADIVRMENDAAMTVDKARSEILASLRKRSENPVSGGGPAIIMRTGGVTAAMLRDVMLMRTGAEDMVLSETDGAKRAEIADKYRDMSALDICRQALALDGREVPASRDEMIRAALNTSTLPTVLGAVFHKSLMKGFGMVMPTWEKWTSVGNLSDFKTHNRVLLTGEGGMELVGDGGDLKLGSETEETASNKLDTYGKKDRFGRQAIINDDLGVLTKVPQRRGRDAMLKIAELVYALLINNPTMDDGIALFQAATHLNLCTSKPLTMDNLAGAITYFKKQKDKAGKRIRVRPQYLLVPDELEWTAKELLQSSMIIAAGSTDVVKGSKNVLENSLEIISETLLSDTTFNARASATTWYVTGSPNEVDTIEVGFLNGRRTPTIHMNPKASDMYIEFESYIDVGVAALGHRGMQKNTA